jgi:hypothetical protein
MTSAAAHIIWTGADETGTYRIVDTAHLGPDRFVFERQLPPDALGGVGWVRVDLPLAGILQQAITALMAR